MFSLPEIGERIRTDDNRATAEPIFLVQEQVRIYGIDTDYDPPIEWIYADECNPVDSDLASSLEAGYQKDHTEPEDYRRVGYQEEWRYVQPFFTEAAADLYIEKNSHRHTGKLRTYVDSAYRNWEWIAVRKQLAQPTDKETIEP